MANALVSGEQRQRSTEAQAAQRLTYLGSIPIDTTNDYAWGEALRLARAHRLSAYDAAYLELALRRGLPLATRDDKLTAAASVVGVPPFAP